MRKFIVALLILFMVTSTAGAWDKRQKVRLIDADGNMIKVDAATQAIQTIESEHHEIHNGSHYIASYDSTSGTVDMVRAYGCKII